MKDLELENILKDLLREEKARKTLRGSSNQAVNQKRKKQYWMGLAASIVLLALLFSPINESKQDFSKEFIAAHYTFPVLNKSRSSQNITDHYFDDLKSKEYKKVLSALQKEPLSEKDLFIKAHLYYSLDSLDEAEDIIQKTKWKNLSFSEESKWLSFIIALKRPSSKEEVKTRFDNLNLEYQELSSNLIRNL